MQVDDGEGKSVTLEQAAPLLARGARMTPWAAAGLGLHDELSSILRADPDSVHARGGDGKTVLHCAATRAIAELVLDSGAEVHDAAAIGEIRETGRGAQGVRVTKLDEGDKVVAAARVAVED